MTHAFFKALLFLGAGSVIHAMSGEQDLGKMGGLKKYTPITFWTLLCASVAIAGIPPFSGYHSKDAILAAAYEFAPWMYWVGVCTAGMTAFYVFRAFFLAFYGEPRWKKAHGGHDHDKHGHDDGHGHGEPHESPASMWIPLAVLAVGSLAGGYINIPKWLEPMFKLHEEAPGSEWLVTVSVAAGVVGIALAALFYLISPGIPEGLARTFSTPYRWIYNKYFVDEFYDALVVNPTVDGSRSLLWRVMDAGGIDGAVNGIGKLSRGIGGILKLMQSGSIRSYAAWVVLGSIVVITAISMVGGGQ
jgi:NADH-quinone oxidoreductase subunit L